METANRYIIPFFFVNFGFIRVYSVPLASIWRLQFQTPHALNIEASAF